MQTLVKQNQEYFHFFHKPQEGLCLRIKKESRWQTPSVLFRETDGCFSVCADDTAIHAVVLGGQNELFYLQYKSGAWTKHKITALKSEIRPKKLLLCIHQHRLHLFCAAQYEEENLLIHFLLGNHAQPRIIDRLGCDALFAHGTHIYYTNAEHQLVYQDFSDHKPDRSVLLFENAQMPCLFSHHQKTFLTYLSQNGDIMLGDVKIAEDVHAIYPILLQQENRLCLLWKSNAFLYCTTSEDDGNTWSPPIQFLHTSSEIDLFEVIENQSRFLYFAAPVCGELHFFANPTLFPQEPPQPGEAPITQTDFDRLRIHLELLQQDVKTLRNQILSLQKQENAGS